MAFKFIMFKFVRHVSIINLLALISQINGSVQLTKSENFVQTIQFLMDRSLNVTVRQSSQFTNNIRASHVALCFSSNTCLAVSDSDNNESLYFAGFGSLPGVPITTIPSSPIHWISMQTLNDETTNYALHGKTFASTIDDDRPPSLAVDGDTNRYEYTLDKKGLTILYYN